MRNKILFRKMHFCIFAKGSYSLACKTEGSSTSLFHGTYVNLFFIIKALLLQYSTPRSNCLKFLYIIFFMGFFCEQKDGKYCKMVSWSGFSWWWCPFSSSSLTASTGYPSEATSSGPCWRTNPSRQPCLGLLQPYQGLLKLYLPPNILGFSKTLSSSNRTRFCKILSNYNHNWVSQNIIHFQPFSGLPENSPIPTILGISNHSRVFKNIIQFQPY